MARQEIIALLILLLTFGPAVLLCLVGILPFVINAIINVFFSPLSEFHGPKLAAATSWWSAYQQAIQGRSMQTKSMVRNINVRLPVRKNNTWIGDIVRIGPNRVCCSALPN